LAEDSRADRARILASLRLPSEADPDAGKGRDMEPSKAWLVVGVLGQVCFFTRFLVQWIASERRRESVIPIYFWYFSIAGGVILLAYSIHRRDPVFILGQSVGLFVYFRNLWLIARRRRVPPIED
jgi:lipid-A-disaccharide synthase-like uncharacterized protein